MRIEVRSCDGDETGVLRDELRAAERALQGRVTRVVAHQQVRGRVGETIHRATRLHPCADRARSPEVLDRGEEPWFLDLEDCGQRVAKNLTRSPARNRQGGSESGRKSFTDVRPIRCQPPGVGSG